MTSRRLPLNENDMRIESGPTRERVIRTAIPLIMFCVFAVWFAYDGWRGYAQKNKEEHLEQLPPQERAKAKDAPIYPNISESELTPEMKSDAEMAIKRGSIEVRRTALKQIFGAPPSWEGSEAWYYFGPALRVKIPLKDGMPAEVLIQKAEKSETTIVWQKAIAEVLTLVALCLILLMSRVLRTRLVLDDNGLALNGGRSIGWDAIKGLVTTDFAKKGWLDLVYRDGDAERKTRLDEYHLARFDAIIDEICRRKGFENPLPVTKPEAP